MSGDGEWALVMVSPEGRETRVRLRGEYLRSKDASFDSAGVPVLVFCRILDEALRAHRGFRPAPGPVDDGWSWRSEVGR